jgi:hypothetical protein
MVNGVKLKAFPEITIAKASPRRADHGDGDQHGLNLFCDRGAAGTIREPPPPLFLARAPKDNGIALPTFRP